MKRSFLLVERGRVRLQQPAGWAWAPSGCAAVFAGEAQLEPSPAAAWRLITVQDSPRPDGWPRVSPEPPLLRAALSEAPPIAHLLDDALLAACATWPALPLDLPLGRSPALRRSLGIALQRPGEGLGEIAQRGGFSPRTFQRALEQECQLPWRAWRQRARLHLVLPAVEDPASPWPEVAAHAGLQTRALGELFQSQLGMNPSAWRRGLRPLFTSMAGPDQPDL